MHLYQLPLFGMQKRVGEKVGRSLGTVEEVKVDDDEVGWGKKLRVRVKIDITKPLARG